MWSVFILVFTQLFTTSQLTSLQGANFQYSRLNLGKTREKLGVGCVISKRNTKGDIGDLVHVDKTGHEFIQSLLQIMISLKLKFCVNRSVVFLCLSLH